MSSLVLSGDTSGTVTLSVPAVSGSNTLTIQAGTGTNSMNTLATAQASTSGTSIDFTGLPSWVKRITVMFSGVSTNSTSPIQIQLGDSGGIENTGYVTSAGNRITETSSTAGFVITTATTATILISGAIVLQKIDGNTFVSSGNVSRSDIGIWSSGGTKTLSDTLDRVRITTVNGTDTFDAGTINIMYEG